MKLPAPSPDALDFSDALKRRIADEIGVAINQQRQQHGGVIRRTAPTRVGFLQRTDIEPINHLNNKPRKVVFRQPFID